MNQVDKAKCKLELKTIFVSDSPPKKECSSTHTKDNIIIFEITKIDIKPKTIPSFKCTYERKRNKEAHSIQEMKKESVKTRPEKPS